MQPNNKHVLFAIGLLIGLVSTGSGQQPEYAGIWSDAASAMRDWGATPVVGEETEPCSTLSGCDVAPEDDTCEPLCVSDLSDWIGYDRGAYLRDPDDAFSAKLNLVMQMVGDANWRESPPPGEDPFESGFVVRRTMVVLSGNAFFKKLRYFYVFQPIHANGDEQIDEAKIFYEFDNGIVFQIGRFRDPSFLRELDVSLARTLGPDRSLIHAVFTTGVLEGFAFNKQTDDLRTWFIAHDGRGSGAPVRGNSFHTDLSDLALSASLDWKLFGEWSQYGDLPSWSDEGWAAFLGLGGYYEWGESGDDNPANNANNHYAWTIDGTLEGHGFSLFTAAVGRHNAKDAPPLDQYGFLIQASGKIPRDMELYSRYEYFDFGGLSVIGNGSPVINSEVNVVTVGINKYFNRHGAKLNVELMRILDPFPVSRTMLGVLADGADSKGQTVLRSQFQLFF